MSRRRKIISHVSMLLLALPQERIDYEGSPGPLQRESFNPEHHSSDDCPIATRTRSRTRNRAPSDPAAATTTPRRRPRSCDREPGAEARAPRAKVCSAASHSNRLLISMQRRNNTSISALAARGTRPILPRRAKERPQQQGC